MEEQQIIGYLAKPFGWYIDAAKKLGFLSGSDNSCDFRVDSYDHKMAVRLGILEEWFNPIYEEYNPLTNELKSILTDFKANNIGKKEAIEKINALKEKHTISEKESQEIWNGVNKIVMDARLEIAKLKKQDKFDGHNIDAILFKLSINAPEKAVELITKLYTK